MNFEKLDRIVLNQDQMAIIDTWDEEVESDFDIEFPLNEGLIILQGVGEDPTDRADKYIRELLPHMTDEQLAHIKEVTSPDIGYYFKVNDETGAMTIKVMEMKYLGVLHTITIDDTFFERSEFDFDSSMYHNTPLKKDKVMQKMSLYLHVTNVFKVLGYMTNVRERVVVTEQTKQVAKPVKKKKKSGNTKTRFTKIKTKTYVFDFEKELSPEKREYARHTEAWTVRGHWRYYEKTGKRVWIKGYKKGMGEPDGKIYTL